MQPWESSLGLCESGFCVCARSMSVPIRKWKQNRKCLDDSFNISLKSKIPSSSSWLIVSSVRYTYGHLRIIATFFCSEDSDDSVYIDFNLLHNVMLYKRLYDNTAPWKIGSFYSRLSTVQVSLCVVCSFTKIFQKCLNTHFKSETKELQLH